MKRSLLAASCSLLLTLATASAELNLTPRLVTLSYGNFPVRRACFLDGDKRYAVTIDPETELIPQTEGALFRFSKLPLATVELRRSPIRAGTPFTPELIAQYAKAARELLAPGAQIWPEEPMVLDPLPINDWKTCRFNFFYHVGGSPIRTDVTFIEMDDRNQIVMITGGRADDYGTVRTRAEEIIRRWHEITPDSERGEN